MFLLRLLQLPLVFAAVAAQTDTLTLTFTWITPFTSPDGTVKTTTRLDTEPFTIYPTNQAVIEPAENDRIPLGSQYTVRWNPDPVVDGRNVDIFLLYENPGSFSAGKKKKRDDEGGMVVAKEKNKRSLPSYEMTQVFWGGLVGSNLSNTGSHVWSVFTELDDTKLYHLKINYAGDNNVNLSPRFGLTHGAAVSNTPNPNGASASTGDGDSGGKGGDSSSSSQSSNSRSRSSTESTKTSSRTGNSPADSAAVTGSGTSATNVSNPNPTLSAPPSPTPGKGGSGSNKAAIVGGVVGGILGGVIIVLLIVLARVGRRHGWFVRGKRPVPADYEGGTGSSASQKPTAAELPSPPAPSGSYSNGYFAELEGGQIPATAAPAAAVTTVGGAEKVELAAIQTDDRAGVQELSAQRPVETQAAPAFENTGMAPVEAQAAPRYETHAVP